MTLFFAVQIIAAASALVFCVAGSGLNLVRRRRTRLQLMAFDIAAELVLTEDHDELESVAADLAAMPAGVVADVLHDLTTDMYGESRRRLRLVAESRGLTRKIQRWSQHRRWTRRIRAAHLLMLLPSDAPEREMLLCDPHPLVRARSIEGLGRIGIGRFAPLLLEAFDDESPAVRSAAQLALAQGGVDCVPPILELLERLDRGTADLRALSLVAEVAAQLPDERLVRALLRFVTHPEPSLRVLVASCLGNGTMSEPEVHLAALLCDDQTEVRAEAARSVGRGDVKGLAHMLGHALADPSWHVRRNSGTALVELGPIGAVILRCHIDDDDAFARDMALHMLGRVSRLGDVLGNSDRWALSV